jgi:methylglutaconyl-CoA hydratase
MSCTLSETSDHRGIATLTLNRPDRHNAFDDVLTMELTAALRRLGSDPEVRALILASSGRSFSACADLDWMRRMARQSGRRIALRRASSEGQGRITALLEKRSPAWRHQG